MTSETKRPGEADSVAYMVELRELEIAGARQEVLLGPYTALVLIGALQLATRHPSMNDHMRDQLGALIDQFRPWFVGTPGEHIIDAGNDAGNDV